MNNKLFSVLFSFSSSSQSSEDVSNPLEEIRNPSKEVSPSDLATSAFFNRVIRSILVSIVAIRRSGIRVVGGVSDSRHFIGNLFRLSAVRGSIVGVSIIIIAVSIVGVGVVRVRIIFTVTAGRPIVRVVAIAV
tara:strand:+ start:59 stop:457 length:399 start_codon:yes stop_codon:yes gene_type:complete